LLPGGAIQFPGGSFIPLWSSAFHGALLTPGYVNNPFPCLLFTGGLPGNLRKNSSTR
jgi:hypothetical protein